MPAPEDGSSPLVGRDPELALLREVKRLALGKVVKLEIRGSEIKLEANAMAHAKGLVEALERARGVAA